MHINFHVLDKPFAIQAYVYVSTLLHESLNGEHMKVDVRQQRS